MRRLQPPAAPPPALAAPGAPAREVGRPRLLAAVALAGCGLAVAAQSTSFEAPLRVACALLFFTLAPGAALTSALTRLRTRLELGLVVAVSLGTFALLGEAMLATHLWRPGAATDILAALCAPFLLARLLSGGLDTRTAAARLREWAHGWAAELAAMRLYLLLLALAIALWAISIPGIDVARISGYGLLPALPASYYLALVAVAVAFAFAISHPGPPSRLLPLAIVALIAVIHGTTPLVYAEPRYTWVYHHLGVINYIRVHGTIHRSTDIYGNWPGFFAGNAWFVHAAGIPPIAYAPWGQVFFELCNAAAILFIVRGLTRDRRLQWTTVWIFLIGNWIGQDYLAPEAFGFFLCLVALGLCLRHAPEPRPFRNRYERLLERLASWIAGPGSLEQVRLPLEGDPAPLRPPVAAILGTVCGLGILISHQLAPIMLLVGLTVFAIVTRRLSLPLVTAYGLCEVIWVALAWPYLHKHFDLVSFDLFPHPAVDTSRVAPSLPGLSVVTDLSRGVVIAITLLAVAGIVRQRRAGSAQPTAVALALAPLALVVVQSYGGEISLRAYLFALPWLSFFAATACRPALSHRPFPRGSWRLLAASLLVGTGFLFAYFGLEKANYVSPDDVAAALWYERNAPPGSVMAYLSSNFPDDLTASYPRYRVYGTGDVPQLVDDPTLRRRGITKADFGSLVAFLRDADDPHTYLVVSPSQENVVELYGQLPRGSVQRLIPLLRSSPLFRQVYVHGRAWIFELLQRRRSAKA